MPGPHGLAHGPGAPLAVEQVGEQEDHDALQGLRHPGRHHAHLTDISRPLQEAPGLGEELKEGARLSPPRAPWASQDPLPPDMA